MAFPTIPTVGAGRVLWQLATSPSGTHTSPSLSSLTKNSGDLLIAIVIIYDGNSTNAEFSSWGGSFTEFKDQAGTATMGIGLAYKWSDGTETGTFTVTSADTSTNDSAFCLLSIPGAHASTPPEAGNMVTGTAPDAASFNPSGWDAEDTLWIAVGGSGEDSLTGSYTGIGTAPTNYTNQADSGISADAIGGVEGSVAFRQLNAASEDPGAWSMDTSNARGAALLIAVRPAVENPTGTGDIIVPTVTVSGTGAEILTATGTITVPPVEVAGVGVEIFTATGAITAEPPVVAGTGDHSESGAPPTGTGAITVPAVEVAGSGSLILTGTGAIVGQPPTVLAAGAELLTATGTIVGQAPTVAGAGTETLIGSGAIVGQAPTVAGAGTFGAEVISGGLPPTIAAHYQTPAAATAPPVPGGMGLTDIPLALAKHSKPEN